MNSQSAMIKQIYSIPDLMRTIRDDLKDQALILGEKICANKIKKVILTGCGDSYCASIAAKFAFLEFTGIEVEVAPVIDLSRFYSNERLIGNNDILIVIVSNSGMVARCIELAERVRKLGGHVLAVTGKEQSGLYQKATMVLKLKIPPFEYAPGIRSYCGCLYGLFQLAFQIGIRSGRRARIQKAQIQLDLVADMIETHLDDWNEKAKAIALKIKSCTSYEFIGSGIHYASAWFAYAKALETTGLGAGAYNTEDWFHMNYFTKEVSRTATFLLARAEETDKSRAGELLKTAIEMGRPVFCITDDKTQNINELIVPKVKESLLGVFVDYLPLAMIMAYSGEILGEAYFRDGKDHWTACVNCATIINSEMVIIEGGRM